MSMTDALTESIRAAGLRVTAPRIAVLRALEAAPHADAETLFGAVQGELPRTSRQAVYGVLSSFAEAGLVRRIEPAGSNARYELRVGDNHHHLVCRDCGRIADVDCVVGHAPCLAPSDTAGFVIDEAEVMFWGRCPDCQQTASRTLTT